MRLSARKIALGIFVFIVLAVVNAMFGNPVSKALADRGADKVIAEKYGDLDLSREKVVYNFKLPEYVVHLQDKTARTPNLNCVSIPSAACKGIRTSGASTTR